MSAQQRIELGDISDLAAYVGKIVRAIVGGHDATIDEVEDLVAAGFELAVDKRNQLVEGQSLQAALGGWLESRLRDVWRQSHREWRRNTRAATAYSMAVPTGLAWEHNEPEDSRFAAADVWRISDSRLSLEKFRSLDDLFDPKKVGRSQGLPSLAAIATQSAREIYATLTEERKLTTPETFVLGPVPTAPNP
jgi:DNA-directed RNA polymerase specialized sigma24 family protein